MAVTSKGTNDLFPLNTLVKGKVKPEKKTSWIRKWRWRDSIYIFYVSLVHVLCFFAPSTFSWSAVITFFTLYVLTGAFGITLSYHRNLAHRSFNLPKFLEYLFAYFGLHAGQGDPIFWVSTHRYHHKVTDTPKDPHSPIEGFWSSHIFWIFDRDKLLLKGADYKNVEDLRRQPYYRFLQNTMIPHLFMFWGLLYWMGGFPFVVWGIGVRTVWFYHITFLVNSVCHIWGKQRWNTGDLSKNNWLLAILAFGEGWHNNHHAFDYSARQGLEWWEVDMTWYAIKMLECLGLATNVKVPSEVHMQKMLLKKG